MSTRRPSATASVPPVELDPNDPTLPLKLFGGAVCAVILLKMLFSAMWFLWIIAFPVIILYAMQQCPSDASFDAKKELKRVLRGHNLPEGHPDKPQGFVNETLSRIKASVATEVATAPGYAVAMYDFIGAFKLAVVTVPTIERDCYWLGAFGQWRYLFMRDLSKTKVD